MINLTKGLTQTIYFTATEKATISNPYFLFVFIHRVTGDVVKLMATNQSITGRYDSFAFTVNNFFNLRCCSFCAVMQMKKELDAQGVEV
jgi:hypothetical protein